MLTTNGRQVAQLWQAKKFFRAIEAPWDEGVMYTSYVLAGFFSVLCTTSTLCRECW